MLKNNKKFTILITGGNENDEDLQYSFRFDYENANDFWQTITLYKHTSGAQWEMWDKDLILSSQQINGDWEALSFPDSYTKTFIDWKILDEDIKVAGADENLPF